MKAEIRRQFIHFLFGSTIIALLVTQGTMTTLRILMTLTLTGIALAFAIKKGIRIPGANLVVERVERENEKHAPGKAAIMFLTGAIGTIVIFQRPEIILGAMIVAVYGDAASTIIGTRFGRHKIAGKKTLEGTIGGIAASLVFLSFLYPLPTAAAAATIGMLAELLPIDDNFTIPAAAGTILHFMLP